MPAILDAARDFAKDERGSVSIETIFIMPALMWAFLASYIWFDAFRARSINVKATYTIADILSREDGTPITPAYLTSMFDLYGRMGGHHKPLMLRVTAIRYQTTGDRYRVVWSKTKGPGGGLTDASLARLRASRLPRMADGEIAIMVETKSRYTSAFNVVWLPTFTISHFMLTRPRFTATQICWSDSDSGPWTAANQRCQPPA